MDIRCEYCGGQIDPNMDRIARDLGNSALVAVVAAAFGLSGGWVALFTSAIGGSVAARWIAQAKLELAKKSKELGGYFVCLRCRKDASVEHVFAQIKKNREKKKRGRK